MEDWEGKIHRNWDEHYKKIGEIKRRHDKRCQKVYRTLFVLIVINILLLGFGA